MFRASLWFVDFEDPFKLRVERKNGGTARIRTGDYQLRRLVPYFPRKPKIGIRPG